MLKNLNAGDRFVDEIGRVFVVKAVAGNMYVTDFIEQIDYEEGQKPYKLEEEKKTAEKQKKAEKQKEDK